MSAHSSLPFWTFVIHHLAPSLLAVLPIFVLSCVLDAMFSWVFVCIACTPHYFNSLVSFNPICKIEHSLEIRLFLYLLCCKRHTMTWHFAKCPKVQSPMSNVQCPTPLISSMHVTLGLHIHFMKTKKKT